MPAITRPASSLFTPGGSWTTPGLPTFTSRDLLIPGTYTPGASTTGVPANVVLTYKGAFTTSAPNQIIVGVRFTGKVVVKHANVVFINCWFEAGTPTPGDPSFNAVKCYDAVSPSTILIDCTIKASVENVNAKAGIQGRSFEMYRCDVSGFVDGVLAMYGNVKVWQCWIHDLPWYEVDPVQVDGSHNDGIQCEGGGGNFDFSYNNIEMRPRSTSAIIVTQNLGVVTSLTIHRNWLRSIHTVDTPINQRCGTGINLTQKGLGPMSNVAVTANLFSPLESWKANVTTGFPNGNPNARAAMYIDTPTFNAATITNNFYEGTTTPVKITKNAV